MTNQTTERKDGETNDPMDSIYCYCLHGSCCQKCGKPRKNRTDTRAVVEALYSSSRSPRTNASGNGPLLMSDIPESSKPSNGPVVIGIDEAGRGSVLGPMVYGMAYWSAKLDKSEERNKKIPKDFNDSKQLNDDTRKRLFEEILKSEDIGFGMKSLLPSEISRNMLRPQPYNLNEMSHDTAMILIRKLLDYGVQIQTAYIDTVGNPGSYTRKLERAFPGVEFIVESKADANYAPCSAASVVAKVMRDKMMEGWAFSELDNQVKLPESNDGNNKAWSTEFGSGYPSDPKCKQWMEELQDPIFGYSDVIRFSWAPTRQKLEDKAIPVTFQADVDDADEVLQQQKGMTAFLGGGGKKRKRLGYFEKRKMKIVSKLE